MKQPSKSKDQLIKEINSLRKRIADLEKLEMEHQRVKNRFQKVLESSPDAIIVTSSEGKILLVNVQTERIFGYKRNELVGKHIEILIPQKMRDAHSKYIAKYLKNPYTRMMGTGNKFYAIRKNGDRFLVEIALNPMEGEDGLLVLSSIRDISNRKNLKPASEKWNPQFNDISIEQQFIKNVLSICASCKNIQDEEGNWNKIEAFLKQHSQTQFSHGICPKCFEKLYPELYEEIKDKIN